MAKKLSLQIIFGFSDRTRAAEIENTFLRWLATSVAKYRPVNFQTRDELLVLEYDFEGDRSEAYVFVNEINGQLAKAFSGKLAGRAIIKFVDE